MIAKIRTQSQQLINPQFNNPKDLVTWMGAVQAQDYAMSKWAVGIRLSSSTLGDVDKALLKGEILRTHVMRPTWHMVAAEDIRWMLKLCEKRQKAAIESWGRNFGLTKTFYAKGRRLLEKMLKGESNLTKQEVEEGLNVRGMQVDKPQTSCILMLAEVEGIICSGIDKGRKHTYALLDERAPVTKNLHKEEALAELALRFFRSHSPASIQDFIWWSSLSATEVKQAIGLIQQDLIFEKFGEQDYILHKSWAQITEPDSILHFLPSYDEYLISYKNRTAVLDLKDHPKAFNNYGIFQPVIMFNGDIVGNWKKTVKKGLVAIETSFFKHKGKVLKKQIKEAEERYRSFLS
ncbi:MAG: winged helix DNA-binding domain-containing protein [Prevotellaceae bacterium]|jgi:hypothetical protein|nr:winged helix DNA-binding domain-containing protein [Prevotellaceae bacterium]